MTARAPVTIRFSLSPREFLRAARGYVLRRVLPRWQILTAVGVVLAVLGYALLVRSRFVWNIASVAALVVAVRLWWTLVAAPRALVRSDARRFSEQRVTYSHEAIAFVTEGTEARSDWRDLRSAFEDGRFYYLEYDHRVFTVIPKRALDEAADARLREYLPLVPRWKPDRRARAAEADTGV